MTSFEHVKVQVEQEDDVNWKMLNGFDYQGKSEVFSVRPGQCTDFASVPRVFVWLLPRYGRWTKAAVLHDHLWRDLARTGQLSYHDADGTFRRAMRDSDVPFLKRWVMWGGVRWAALVKPGGLQGWFRDLPRLLLVSVVVLPIVVPPAVVVIVALAAFFLVECVLWVPLKVTEIVKRRTGRGVPKRVVAPRLTWKV
jgi:hypothetical protein